MSMSKKDFIALADMLRDERPILPRPESHHYDHVFGRQHEWNLLRDALADFCAKQNPNFNRERWLEYIAGTNGPSGGKV